MIVNDHDKKWKQLKKYLRGGGSIAVQVKGGDHDDHLIITNIDFRNDHDHQSLDQLYPHPHDQVQTLP